ncbi:MAG TPA: hypothetical protein VFQ90_16690 [Stellaceae bacterium]|nr:hypothetical protein [Stellaceae bacterium]
MFFGRGLTEIGSVTGAGLRRRPVGVGLAGTTAAVADLVVTAEGVERVEAAVGAAALQPPDAARSDAALTLCRRGHCAAERR